ncbi:hypothetical protein MTQ10_04630 [Streptomyces sp. XM83C]|uniref:hypothetical protein n=1 Tax=Streptomyces sp. NPDC006186 TaxID=3155248 RepID=UPI001FF86AF3|nr:hypothetical protein [Streptomyces sp. XM83C]MCK1818908.1 hypothetical protein [Streptomyces sp. XM83C]
MGVVRRIRRRPALAGLVGLVAVGVGGVVACDPAGGLSAAAVAYTTDQTATAELERRDTGVQWLNCTGTYGSGQGVTPSAGEQSVATVDCTGRTEDGRDISVKGRVTKAVSGSCVRGDLVARVGGKQVFRVSGLGTCEGTPSPVRPPDSGSQPGRPTVTVTVTRTVWCEVEPHCRPVEGK